MMAWTTLGELGTERPQPEGRWGHAMTAVTTSHLLVNGGLAGGHMFNDTWLFDISSGRWTQAVRAGTPPTPRWGHSATLIGSHQVLVLGGREGSKPMPFHECYVLDTRSFRWTHLSLPKPAPKNRYAHTATLLGDGKTILVFAGHGGRTRYYKDVHLLDTSTQTWYLPAVVGGPPPKRSGHAMVRVGNRCFAFGGFNGKEILSDLHMLDIKTFTWTELKAAGSPLPPMVGHSCTTIPGTTAMLIYGGSSSASQLSPHVYLMDTTTPTTSVLTTHKLPAARFWHRSVIVSNTLVVYGGSGARGAAFSDVVALDLHPLLAPPAPAPPQAMGPGTLMMSHHTDAASAGAVAMRAPPMMAGLAGGVASGADGTVAYHVATGAIRSPGPTGVAGAGAGASAAAVAGAGSGIGVMGMPSMASPYATSSAGSHSKPGSPSTAAPTSTTPGGPPPPPGLGVAPDDGPGTGTGAPGKPGMLGRIKDFTVGKLHVRAGDVGAKPPPSGQGLGVPGSPVVGSHALGLGGGGVAGGALGMGGLPATSMGIAAAAVGGAAAAGVVAGGESADGVDDVSYGGLINAFDGASIASGSTQATESTAAPMPRAAPGMEFASAATAAHTAAATAAAAMTAATTAPAGLVDPARASPGGLIQHIPHREATSTWSFEQRPDASAASEASSMDPAARVAALEKGIEGAVAMLTAINVDRTDPHTLKDRLLSVKSQLEWLLGGTNSTGASLARSSAS